MGACLTYVWQEGFFKICLFFSERKGIFAEFCVLYPHGVEERKTKDMTKFSSIIARVLPALLFAGVLAVVSCQKESVSGNESNGSVVPEGFKFSLAPVAEATKTWLLDGTKVCWSDGDSISVNGCVRRIVPFSDDITVAMLEGEAPEPATSSPKYKAWYPVSAAEMSLPDTVYYNAKSPLGVSPMYAESDKEIMTFNNLCGLIEIKLKGTKTIKQIDIYSYTSGKGLSGTFSLSSGSDGIKYATVSGTGNITMKFKPGEEVTLNNEGKSFYIPIPAAEYDDMKVKFTNTEGYVFIKKFATSTNKVNIARGYIHQTVMEIAHWGIQMWADGPVWATTNLGATKPEEPGNYYAWAAWEPWFTLDASGDTTWRRGYKEEGYTWMNTNYCVDTTGVAVGDAPKFNKYNATDSKTVLDPNDDAAYQAWGPAWRMPTKDEYETLFATCPPDLKLIGGKPVKYCTSVIDSNMEIVFPAAGYYDGTAHKKDGLQGWYWSRTLVGADPANAYSLIGTSDPGIIATETDRRIGCLIRPICND